jgi:hypothetical protein
MTMRVAGSKGSAAVMPTRPKDSVEVGGMAYRLGLKQGFAPSSPQMQQYIRHEITDVSEMLPNPANDPALLYQRWDASYCYWDGALRSLAQIADGFGVAGDTIEADIDAGFEWGHSGIEGAQPWAVDEFVVPAGEAGRFSLPTPEDVACTGTSGDGPGPGTAAAPASAAAAGASGTNLADLIICEIPIDLTAGAAWPLDRVSFFHHAHSTTKFRMRKDEVSAMLPDVCQERRVRAYCRNSDPAAVGAAAAAFAAWRARRFGGKVGSSTPIRAPRPGTVPSSSGGDRAAEAHPAFDVAQETLKRRRLDMDAAAGAQ